LKEDWFNGRAIVLFVIVAVAVALLSPRFGRRPRPAVNACINNLRQLDGAAEQWRLENGRATNAIPTFAEATACLKSTPVCPSGGIYRYETNTGLPRCSVPGHVLR